MEKDMRWKSKREGVDWDHLIKELENPKVNENGEEYYDITPCEAALIDKFAEVCAGFRMKEDPKLPVSVRRANDEKYDAYNQRQFAYLNRGPTNG